ncbi:MAG: hypothetical protein AB8B80_00055 [Marinicellaceae bacterium]
MSIIKNNSSILTVIWVFILSVLSSSLPAQEINYSALEKSINAYEKKLDNLKENLDNTLFDEQELIISLDFDADQIISFVQNRIAFQPYEGLLRGIQGTLVSRSGNALDQSLLLAKMLGDAGFDTRIASGLLTQEQAKNLVMQTQTAKLPEHIGVGEDFEKALAKFDTREMKPKDWENSLTYQRYVQAKTSLEKVLKNNNVTLKNIDVTSDLIKKTQPYFWVEYRLGVSDSWQTAHATITGTSKLNIEAKSYFKDSVPEKYFHKVRIEAFIEQRIKDKLVKHSLMPAWEKPSANLFNVPITYSNQPSGLSKNEILDLTKMIDKATFFTPLLNGKNMGGKVFDMKGRVIGATAMNSDAGKLFQTVGNKGLLAVDALNSLGNKSTAKDESKPKPDKPKSAMSLHSHWIQITFIQPNGEEYTQKRMIYTHKHNQTKVQAKMQLLTEYLLLNNTAEHSLGYLASVYVNLIKDSLPLFKASTQLVLNNNNKTNLPKMITSEFEILAQYHWMNANPKITKDTIRYRAISNMLGIKRGYSSEDKAFLAVDIINNKQNFLKVEKDKILHVSEAAFSQGIWETASEWIPSKIAGLSTNIDALKVTSAAENQNIDMVLKSSSENDVLEINKIFSSNTQSINRVKADTDLGYSIITPTKEPNGLMMNGWWRLNPLTGEILGMTADGGGQSMTEYIIENLQIALGLIRALGNIQKCEKIKEAGAKVCCLLKAHINNVTGLAVGGFNGAVGGTMASAIFDIADFGKEMVTGSGIVPGASFSCKPFDRITDLSNL